uniref:ANK_REP_REGION domain-containing protein n=1 Tax=Parastrongyloides trichosuri TaxID=131310 RepID=A0A0N4ZCT2_PARTI
MEKAVKSWRYNMQLEPDKTRTPVKVDFNLNIKFAAACKASDFVEIKKYLEEGANINYVGPDGLTPLHNAIIDDNCEVVKILVENGSDVNIQDPMYWTPLHSAIEMGDLNIIQILLDNGADPSLINSDEKLPIDLAKDDDIIDVIEKKMKELNLDVENLRDKERLSIRRDINTWYKEKHYDEEPHPLTGCYAIHVCAAKNYLPELYALVSKKICDPNLKDYDGWTPLHGAIYWNNCDAAEILIMNGADINAKTNNNENIFEICDTEETKKMANDILKGKYELKGDIAKYELDKFQLPSDDEKEGTVEAEKDLPIEVNNEITALKQKIEEATTDSQNVTTNNENIDKHIGGVPWDRTNKLKKVENNVKMFNAINANRCNVVPPNPRLNHDESESERKMISKQRRSARRSTRGITQEELKEVMNSKKNDDLKYSSSSSSFDNSLNKLPFNNSRSAVSKRSELYNNDNQVPNEIISCKLYPTPTSVSNISSLKNNLTNLSCKDKYPQSENNYSINDIAKHPRADMKIYKHYDTNLAARKDKFLSASLSLSSNYSTNGTNTYENSGTVRKLSFDLNEDTSVKSSDNIVRDSEESKTFSNNIFKTKSVDEMDETNYKEKYFFEKIAHEKLQKEHAKLKYKLDKLERELKATQLERDKLEQLKSENSALVRVLGKLTKEDGYKKN